MTGENVVRFNGDGWRADYDVEAHELTLSGNVHVGSENGDVWKRWKHFKELIYDAVSARVLPGSSITEARDLFASLHVLRNVDLSEADMSHVESTSDMFDRCRQLEHVAWPEDGVHGLKNTRGMFDCCENLADADIVKALDMSEVKNAGYMFSECTSLKELDVSGWDTHSLKYGTDMFGHCASLKELDVSGWDTRALVDATAMFQGCESLEHVPVDTWDVPRLYYASNMLYGCSSLTSVDLSAWHAQPRDVDGMFRNCSSLTSADLSGWDTSLCSRLSNVFSDCKTLESVRLDGWDTSGVHSTIDMFRDCTSLRDIRCGNHGERLSLASVTRSDGMFSGCASLSHAPFVALSREAAPADEMFDNCPFGAVAEDRGFYRDAVPRVEMSATGDTCYLSGTVCPESMHGIREEACASGARHVVLQPGSVVTCANDLFSGWSFVQSVDMTACDMTDVQDARHMFYDCWSLRSVAFPEDARISGDASYMFGRCGRLEGMPLVGLDTSGVHDMRGLFTECSGVRDFVGVDMSGALNVKWMFEDCPNLKHVDFSSLDVPRLRDATATFFCYDSRDRSFTLVMPETNDSMLDDVLHAMRVPESATITQQPSEMRSPASPAPQEPLTQRRRPLVAQETPQETASFGMG